MENTSIILGSGSPRRSELLTLAGVKFIVDPSRYEEEHSKPLPPEELIQYLAQKKAEEVTTRHEEGIVIAADTMIVCEGRVIGKPTSRQDAIDTMTLLSGNTHDVITAYTLLDASTGKHVSRAVTTQLQFFDLSHEEITSYVDRVEPYDFAGAYAIQADGALFVERITGSYTAVVGLPIAHLMRDLADFSDHA